MRSIATQSPEGVGFLIGSASFFVQGWFGAQGHYGIAFLSAVACFAAWSWLCWVLAEDERQRFEDRP